MRQIVFQWRFQCLPQVSHKADSSRPRGKIRPDTVFSSSQRHLLVDCSATRGPRAACLPHRTPWVYSQPNSFPYIYEIPPPWSLHTSLSKLTNMSSAPIDHASLSYFQTSPVRGQLEPYEPQSRTGWRYLQCTDTPNELKVCHLLTLRPSFPYFSF